MHSFTKLEDTKVEAIVVDQIHVTTHGSCNNKLDEIYTF